MLMMELRTMRKLLGRGKKDETEQTVASSEQPNEETVTSSEQANEDAVTSSVIKSLMKEEASLTEQRDRLLTLKEQLQLKAKEKIETLTSSIQKLKNQVSELRLQCEQLKEFIYKTS